MLKCRTYDRFTNMIILWKGARAAMLQGVARYISLVARIHYMPDCLDTHQAARLHMVASYYIPGSWDTYQFARTHSRMPGYSVKPCWYFQDNSKYSHWNYQNNSVSYLFVLSGSWSINISALLGILTFVFCKRDERLSRCLMSAQSLQLHKNRVVSCCSWHVFRKICHCFFVYLTWSHLMLKGI